jgi:hypothetical protein
MAISIRIPGLLSLVWVAAPAEIAAVNDAAQVSRSPSGRGGLINRAIAAKFAPFRAPDGDIWPAFRARLDPVRLARQRELAVRLADVEALLRRIAPEVAALAGYAAGAATPAHPGAIAQQAIGRLFFEDYAATRQSYDAAVTLSTWLAAGPLKSRRLRRSGLQAALDEIVTLARGDTTCAHATGIALHNIVTSIDLMRELACSGDNLSRLTPREAAARTLRAPATVVREARDSAQIGNVRMRARSLVLFQVESARRKSPDGEFGFFGGHWNQCPAHAIVPALLAEVWRVAATNARAADPQAK